ncbi:recombinase family protein [Methylobacterium dankookense]|uniref:Resolvase/invertase-type recombinase catalytic domain-containing protein n=1 Tax=Methylobacterium dankookense TaxID=560405 RepID=A0A564G7V7_9HYPH|nr:hypothetical protein IFDJLNFL_3437 [Methylobacterium dankookense]VUF16064.1 hypothetical protein MTDSW087_05815 [Methylobacterium dankookense]
MTTAPRPLVAYNRVSTDRQGKSGLGLEAQRALIASFAQASGFEIVEEFEEVQTGKGADALERRLQLAAALAAARKHTPSLSECHLSGIHSVTWGLPVRRSHSSPRPFGRVDSDCAMQHRQFAAHKLIRRC